MTSDNTMLMKPNARHLNDHTCIMNDKLAESEQYDTKKSSQLHFHIISKLIKICGLINLRSSSS